MPIANVNWNGQMYRINFDRQLSDNEVFDYMQKNYPKQETVKEEIVEEKPKKTVKEFYTEQLKPVAEKLGEKALGIGRGLTQGATIGQAPHLAGVTNELANLPKKVYGATTIQDIAKLYKNLGKDYVKGREDFKQQYKDFEDKNKGVAIASELLGGLASGGGLLKGFALAKNPLKNLIAKGMLEGAGFGGAYGGSNTEGKAVDLKNAGIGAGIGAVAGGILPLGIEGIKGIGTLAKLYNKGVDKVAEKAQVYRPVKETVENVAEKTQVADDIQQLAKEKTPFQQEIKEQNPLITKTETQTPTTRAVEGDVISYIKNDGMPDKTLKYIRDNEAVRDEIVKRQGDFGMRHGTYGEEAIKSISEITPKIKQAEQKAYKEAFEKVGIKNGDEYFVKANQEVTDDINNAINQYNSRLTDEYAEGIVELNPELANNYKKLLNRDLINNGGINFGKLKAITRTVNNLKKRVARDEKKGKDSAEFEFLNSISRAFSKLKQTDPILSGPNNKFSTLEKAMERLEEEGGFRLDDKGAKQNAAKIFQNIRDRAGNTQENALDEFTNAIGQFDDTQELINVKNKIQTAQASYGARDSVRDNKLSADVTKIGRNPLNYMWSAVGKAWNGQNLTNEELVLMLAKGLKEGKIKPSDLKTFGRVKVPNMSDFEANRLYLLDKLFGIKASGLKGATFRTLGGK